MQTPSGRTVSLPPNPSGKLVFTDTEELGVYRVSAAGKLIQQFAINLLDEKESDIRLGDHPSFKIGYVNVAGKSGWVAGHRDIWKELVLAALAIALLEWLIYLRRVYV